ncbi:MAG TPA: GlsB/YeaQ/YmgE family stress response membrane protein [Candidatus Solibacter sp.]|nr:GlsB/YeaQ/YmgE family stress response membrane protein [Candidatus Solibacter sp.]
MLSLLWELIIGLVVGAVAKFLMPGKDPGGIWITMLIGIAGSILATYLGQAIGWYRAGQGAGFIMSVVGAIVLLFLYRIIRGSAAKS